MILNQTLLFEKDIFDHVIELIEEHGAYIWWEWEAHTNCYFLKITKNKTFYKKRMDIMDVWFDSGSTSIAVNIEKNIKAPFDLYLEGSDH